MKKDCNCAQGQQLCGTSAAMKKDCSCAGAGSPREKACLQSLSVMHVSGDPLEKGDLEQRLHVSK